MDRGFFCPLLRHSAKVAWQKLRESAKSAKRALTFLRSRLILKSKTPKSKMDKYFSRKRQCYNWFYDQIESGIIAKQGSVEFMFYANEWYYPLWTLSQWNVTVTRSFTAPEFKVTNDWSVRGYNLPWTPSESPAIVPNASWVELNEYHENPSWAPYLNFGANFVGYFEEYYSEEITGIPFITGSPLPVVGAYPTPLGLTGTHPVSGAENFGIRLFQKAKEGD